MADTNGAAVLDEPSDGVLSPPKTRVPVLGFLQPNRPATPEPSPQSGPPAGEDEPSSSLPPAAADDGLVSEDEPSGYGASPEPDDLTSSRTSSAEPGAPLKPLG